MSTSETTYFWEGVKIIEPTGQGSLALGVPSYSLPAINHGSWFEERERELILFRAEECRGGYQLNKESPDQSKQCLILVWLWMEPLFLQRRQAGGPLSFRILPNTERQRECLSFEKSTNKAIATAKRPGADESLLFNLIHCWNHCIASSSLQLVLPPLSPNSFG